MCARMGRASRLRQMHVCLYACTLLYLAIRQAHTPAGGQEQIKTATGWGGLKMQAGQAEKEEWDAGMYACTCMHVRYHYACMLAYSCTRQSGKVMILQVRKEFPCRTGQIDWATKATVDANTSHK